MEDNYEVFDDFKPAKADDGISTFVKETIEKELQKYAQGVPSLSLV